MTLYVAEQGVWTARGLPAVAYGNPPATWPPVLGSYKPGPTTTGPRPSVALVRHDGDFRITTPGQVVEGLDIYGRVIVTATAVGAVVRNCIIRGPGPAWISGFVACIDGTSSTLRGLLVEDSRVDCTGRENPWVDAVRGSDVTLRRVEITRVGDGLSLVTVVGNVTAEGCWLHDGYYAEWIKGTVGYPTISDARVHGDAVQFHRGKGYTLRYNNLGGTRNPGPYHQSPYNTVDAKMVAYKDAGEDYENSCFMIKQEVDSSAANKVENVLIEGNWLAGGASSINLSYSLLNTMASVSIINNRFIRSTWGAHLYIIRDTAIAAVLTGNVFDDDQSPVPITKGITN